MGLNSVTTDLSRYRDAQHFDPGIGRLIADRLLGRPVPAPHGDFGRPVTRGTIHTARARLTEGGVAGAAGCPVAEEEEPAASRG